jgi:heme/copper-type cytochrome/quinol oxidase subunit 2
MAMVIAGTIFLRWMPSHGWFSGTLVCVTLLTAVAISVTQKYRYHRAVRGIGNENIQANTLAVMSTSASVLLLAALGVYTVVLIPLHP